MGITRVAIVEDSDDYQEVIKATLEDEPNINIHGVYGNGLDFIKSLDSPFQPDVFLIDIVLPDISGFDCAKKAREKNQDAKIIIITAYERLSFFADAQELQADYIEKGRLAEILLSKIILSKQEALQERIVLLKNNSNADVYKEYSVFIKDLQESKNNYKSLSAMQTRVLKLKSTEKSRKNIAKELGISANTVDSHIERAIKKLKLPDPIKAILAENQDY